MIGIEHVWGACGVALGTVIACVCMTGSLIWEEYVKEKKRITGSRRR